jgi:hypothetical protein
MHNYAPFSSARNDEPCHDPADIISDILPTPVIRPKRKDFFSQTSDWSIQAGLANVIGIDTSNGNKRSIYLESEELKCYALSSTTQSFNTLMQNELLQSRRATTAQGQRSRARLLRRWIPYNERSSLD